jgi:hypothetical protein
MDERTLPPWTYIVLERDTEEATVCVRLLAAALPSQGSGKESVEALVELPWRDGYDDPTIQRDALLRLRALIHAEIERLGE